MKHFWFIREMASRPAVVSLAMVVLLAVPLAAGAQMTLEATEGYAAPAQKVEVRWQAKMPQSAADVRPNCDLGKTNRYPPKPERLRQQEIRAPQLPQTQLRAAADSDFQFFKKHALTNAESSTSTSNVLEPTTARYGRKILYTGNWFAAKSTDGGNSFVYVDPFTLFTPPAGMQFCCDQEVIYDRTRGMWIWSLLYVTDDEKGGANRIAISTDLNTWWYYDFNVSTTLLSEYPHLALSDNFLYVTTNQWNLEEFVGSLIFRVPLTEMRLGRDFQYSYLTRSNIFNWTLAKNFGHQNVAYFATNYILAGPYDRIRVYTWPETSSTLSWHDIDVSPWTFAPFTCTTPDATNPCARADDRILGATITNWGAPGVTNKVLWLSWNANVIDGRPMPYTYVVKINATNWTVLGYADLWSPSYSWFYTAISPNDRGHIALATNALGGTQYEDFAVSIYDDITPSPPPDWQLWLVRSGNKGPSNNKWGDYNCVDRSYPNAFRWVASGHVKLIKDTVLPYFVDFGRARDQ